MIAPSGVELGPGCTWQPGRWESHGPLVYAMMSYGLWLRHFAYDLVGRKPKKRLIGT